VESNVTMADSSGRRLWHMRFQSCENSRRESYVISNGWREFAYDHNLKINDSLVFTLMSTSHFVVEFGTSKGSTRAMLPRRNGNDYPWRINYSRLRCLAFAGRQGVKKKRNICKNVQDDEDDDFQGVKKKRIRKNVQGDDQEYVNNEPANTPRSFTKSISLKCGIHTARGCRLVSLELM
jgi:hypothetical protein